MYHDNLSKKKLKNLSNFSSWQKKEKDICLTQWAGTDRIDKKPMCLHSFWPPNCCQTLYSASTLKVKPHAYSYNKSSAVPKTVEKCRVRSILVNSNRMLK